MPEPPKDVTAVVLSRFLIVTPQSESFDGFNGWAPGTTPIALIANAFRSNLESAIQVASVPFQLVNAAVHRRHFDRIYSSERIRQLKYEIPDTERDAQALSIARTRFLEERQTEEYSGLVRNEIVHRLYESLKDADFNVAADELLRQTTVMIWGAFEVIATDAAIQCLNQLPALALDVMASEIFKKLGLSKGISVETLQEFSFDVSRSMGTILFGERRLDSLPVIISVCQCLYKNSELDQKLKSSNLWTLAQRRHLIVHRRGFVDASYLSKTPDQISLGSKIVISAQEVEDYLFEVADIGLAIASLAEKLLS
jgi:hypothetical protein